MSAAPTTPRQLLDRPARRAAILKGAAEAFAAKGYTATSMEDVAAAAGITKLIVYRHFDSKQALYDEVLEQVSVRLRDEFLAELAGGRPGVGAVRALVTVAREDPAGFTLLWRHAAREPQFAEHADALRERAVTATERLLEMANVGGGRRRHWAAATLVSYLVEAVLHWLEEGTPQDDDELVDMLARSLPPLVQAWAV
jgi:AcrR family transcriptional regulator